MTCSSPTLSDTAPNTPVRIASAEPLTDGPVAGRLRLGIARRNGRSYACDQFHEGALRVLRPHYLDGSGDVTYTVINPGGAYLGADAYQIDVDVAQDAALLLTTQSATKVYRTPQGRATQDMTVRLHAGATLEYVPDQLIVYRGGSYRQRTQIVMHPQASLVLAEIVTPGWDPDGGVFTYDELRMRTQIDVADVGGRRLFAVDQLRIVPDPRTSGIGVMEGHTHAAQLLIADARVDDDLVDEVASLLPQGDVLAAVSRIGAPDPTAGSLPMSGMALRALANRTEDLFSLQLTVINLLRERWRQRPPIHLRKY